MGQVFALAAPRKGKALDWGGGLGEILFDGPAQNLVRLLAVPVLPRHASAAYGSKAPSPASTSTGLRINEVPSAKRKASGLELESSSRKQKRLKQGDAASSACPANSFSALPTEVHRLIFTQIDSVEDVVCLGLTSTYFWSIGCDYLHAYCSSFLGRWAGENIVCVGNYVEPGDFPPGLFSAAEEEELRDTMVEKLYGSNGDEANPQETGEFRPITLYDYTHRYIAQLESDTDPHLDIVFTKSIAVYNRCQARNSRADSAFRIVLPEFSRQESHFYPAEEKWILRNLTTQEYVRSDVVALKPEYIRGPHIDVFGFGEVVMSRICWSSDPSVGIIDPSCIHRGVWAGHRFDITTWSRHLEETQGANWTDVSLEVVEQMAKIWERNYKGDWRDSLCKNA